MESLISRLDQALNGQKKPILVFDIDSTIFNVSPRNQAIFDLFCSINATKNPFLLNLSSNYRLTYTDWGLDPYTSLINTNDELKKGAVSFWKKHFFAGTFLPLDQPYDKVIELIKLMHSKGAVVLYLTGRDDHRMREGTLAQLKHWSLPLEKDSDLITKPHKGMKDGEYKSGALLEIFKSYPQHHVFFFDNEPSVLKHCIFPELDLYTPIFINSTHSSRSTPQPHWPSLDVLNYDKVFSSLKGTTI
ncbi:MAG: HAD family hydrolase [Bdellovibrionales bacterium]